MKKLCITFLLLLIIMATAVIAVNFPTPKDCTTHADYVRIHVRANSNEQADQQIKYAVKDEVVKFLTPYIALCDTRDKALLCMQDKLAEIEAVCDRVLAQNGYFYGAKASLRQEKFPTRVYGELTLNEGVYDALIVELGTGTGDNWWCVLYPPLCFTGGEDVTYRSLIFDIIHKFI